MEARRRPAFMEENKSCLPIRIKCPKKSPPLTDSDNGWKIARDEGKLSFNSNADKIANAEYPNSTTPTCPECGRTFPSNKSLFGHLRCHPERSFRGVHQPPMGMKKRHYSEAHDSAAKPLPSAPKWPTGKRGRKLPRENEDDAEEAAAVRIPMRISKSEPVVIVNGLKTREGKRIVKKKIMEESELENAEPGACGSEYQKEATQDPSPSAYSSDQTDHKKASYRVFDFDLNAIPKPEGEEES